MKKRDLKKIRVIYFKIFDLPSHQVLLTKEESIIPRRDFLKAEIEKYESSKDKV